MSLNPRDRKEGGDGAGKKKFRSVGQLNKELDEAMSRISYLEQKLASAGIKY